MTSKWETEAMPLSTFGPDFPFGFDDWLTSDVGLGNLPQDRHGTEVAIIGAGMAGMTAAFELMRLGLKPVIYEAGRIGGRLRSQTFDGTDHIVAELGGMRFPTSARAFYHYVEKLSLKSRPFPNPLSEATHSTVIDLAGETTYVENPDELPPLFAQVSEAYHTALDAEAHCHDLKTAIAAKDVTAIKGIWNPLIAAWDDRTFYDFLSQSEAFSKLGFRHREIFGQVGFGTGGWDSDFSNSMLEILRVHGTEQEEGQRWIVGGATQVPLGLWRLQVDDAVHWPRSTSLQRLHGGGTLPGAARMFRDALGKITIIDRWGREKRFDAVLCTCQSWLLTTAIDVDESLFSQAMWMALDRTRYMQSSKTFVMVDRPFWLDRDPQTGRHLVSTTLTDRITRGTYLFDNGPDQPGVICLTYTWMSDALKMLPLPVERRVDLALQALAAIYPTANIQDHIIGDPITVSWESDPNFLGAFKGALPGHYRYNQRMYAHFMQDDLPPHQRGVFLAGDDISWTPGWVEGAVQTALNAVWGIVHHLGGDTASDNPGPGDLWADRAPLLLEA